MGDNIIKRAKEWLSCYPDSYAPTKMWKEIITGLLEKVNQQQNQLDNAADVAWIMYKTDCEKLEVENTALKEEVKKLKNNNQWYVDYANDKDKDVCKWIGEANKLEAENEQLSKENAALKAALGKK